MEQEKIPQIISASELLEKLFTETLADKEKYDPDVVEITKTHLGSNSPHSKAGNNLATALIELSKRRVSGGQK